MTAPQRRRPGGASQISLTPRVEAIRTPGTPGTAPAAEQEAADSEPPTSQPTADVNREPAQPAAPRQRAERKPAGKPERLVPPAVSGLKIARTFQIREELVRQAETAVLRTAGYNGGHVSMTALVNEALRRELERLAEEFNSGEEFPQNVSGQFRTGRPIGT